MTTFIEIDDTTHIALAAIRSIKRSGDKVKIEFTDGTVRGYAAKLDMFNYLDDLVGELVPAAPGWRLAEYDYITGKVWFQSVIAFRIKPGGLEPVIAEPFAPDDYTLVDPHGRFIGSSYELPSADEAGFLKEMQARIARRDAAKDAAE